MNTEEAGNFWQNEAAALMVSDIDLYSDCVTSCAIFHEKDWFMKMRYKSKTNKPLLEKLTSLFALYGFEFEPDDDPHSTDIALWKKPFGATMKAEILVTLSGAAAPNMWSLEPIVTVNSAYAGYWYSQLRLYCDFYPVGSSYSDPEYLQAFRFLPAHIRWQEHQELEFARLEGRLETIDSLMADMDTVFKGYVIPLLEQLRDPLAVAEFQLRAEKEFRCTRLGWDEARYKVSNRYVSTALLFDEAGEISREIEHLEQALSDLAGLINASDPIINKQKCSQLERLLNHLRNKQLQLHGSR